MSLAALVDGLFDYAGMFPPATLDFEDALRETAGFRTSLSRPTLIGNDMVLTAKTLPALDTRALRDAGWADGRPFRLCVVGAPLPEAERLGAGLRRFNEDRAHDAIPQRATSLEVTTEATTPFAIEALARPLDAARRAMRADTRLYLEPRWEAETWRTRGEDLLHVLRAAADTGPAVGLKVRCAGETALDHETLAHVLLRVADEGLPLKVTQGLHHPLIEAATYGNAHGFLGLAAALWYRAALGPAFSEEDMRACLGSSTATDLDLADGLSWRAHAIAETVLLAARERVPLSIGSCSISEPDADLARLFPTAPVTPEQAR